MPCRPFKSSLHIVLPLFIKKSPKRINTFQAVAAHNAVIGAEIEFGAPDWVRTSDLRLRKPTLFQLSYGYKKVRKDTRKSAFAQKNLCYFDLETQPQIQYNHAKSC